MKGEPILHLRGGTLEVQCTGSLRPPSGIVGRLRFGEVSVSIEPSQGLEIEWWDPDGQIHDNILGGGPILFEECDYGIQVRSRAPSGRPEVSTRDQRLLRNMAAMGEDYLAGSFNLKGQVGSLALTIRDRSTSITLVLEVVPTKMDYATDYVQIVNDISQASRALALSYFRATTSAVGRGGNSELNLDWLTILRDEIERLDRACRYIQAHPHRALDRQVTPTRIEKIRRPSQRVIRAIQRGKGAGQWTSLPTGERVRSMIPSNAAFETSHTPENRWLADQLRAIALRLAGVYREMEGHLRGLQRSRGTRSQIERQETICNEVLSMARRVDNLAVLPIFATAMPLERPDFSSLVLLSRAGYSDAYRTCMALRIALSPLGEGTPSSVKNVAQLYETWCFLQVVRRVAAATRAPVMLSPETVPPTPGQLDVALRSGAASAIRFDLPGGQLAVLYNPRYPGLTGAQKPDVVINVERDGMPSLFIVFDAKYRLDASRGYTDQFGIPGPPVDAINALHRYRDAIVIDARTAPRRPVVRGAALYPLPLDLSEDYGESVFPSALDSIGIGAIPLLPGNEGILDSWLRWLLDLPFKALTDAAPPFEPQRPRFTAPLSPPRLAP